MPISLNNLVKKSRTISIDVEGGALSVTYDPSKLSAAYMQSIQEQLQDDDPLAMAEMFCHIVTDWDLVGPLHEKGHNEFVEDGKPVPMEKRFVAWIPTPILQEIITTIGEDASPKSAQKGSQRR